MNTRHPSRAPVLIGILLGLIGLVWLAQGSGLVGGSAMSGSAVWAVIGLVALIAGGATVAWGARRT